ncbi:MAG: efflux RND transporter permease subunit [Gammaproteobacteria bacterium]|nr:efflux RND transporter permease subunit [Gammaproteobacteria bacterium]
MNSIITYLIDRPLVVNLISVFIIGIGLYSVLNINREAFPDVNLDQIRISFQYPGASPEEIEKLVISPIEQELKSLDGIDSFTSTSFPGSGKIDLELEPDSPNRDRITSEVQIAVDRAELPLDLPREPVVLEIDGRMFPVIQLAISAPKSDLELKRIVDQVEDDLLSIKGVARIQVQGDRRSEIRVIVDPDKLAQHDLSVSNVINLLSSWNVNAPGGEIDTPSGQKTIRIVGEFKDANDVGNLAFATNELGREIKLSDVASITEALEKPRLYFDMKGIPAFNLIVLKKSDSDIISVVDEVKDYIQTIPKRYGQDIEVTTFQDKSRFTKMRLGVLTNNGIVGIFLVLLTLALFLRPSVAITTTIGLPIVFFTGLYVLFLYGISLNLVSMLGFIMVLGMLVDDAIIIGENITYHLESGMPPRQAAIQGAAELVGPVTTTILTTVVAFIPLLFMSGMIGKFIVSIPAVVITLLIFSWLESFLILPSHIQHFTRPENKPIERKWILYIENLYHSLLSKALNHYWITILVSFFILIVSLIVAKNALSFQLFPSVGVDQFIVRVTAPPGTTLSGFRKTMLSIDQDIRLRVKKEHLETTLITTGQVSRDASDPLTQRGSRFGQIRVIYIPAVARKDHDALDDMKLLRNEIAKLYPNLVFAFGEIKPGPPTGRPLEVELTSSDNKANELAANNLIEFLKTVEGVTTIETGLQPGDDELHVVVNRAMASYVGVDLKTIATHIRASVDGLRVSTIRRGTEEVDITIRYPNIVDDPDKLLEMVKVPNKGGYQTPLSKLAKLEKKAGFTAIRHKAGIRVVNVTANIDSKLTSSLKLNQYVLKHEKEWLGELYNNVRVNYGGENEKNSESFSDLLDAFGFAMVAIFFILAIQFNNLSYPLAVMLAIPFGIIGVIISFYFHDLFWKPMPLSFFSTMGMVALTGVVVNSSLVLLVFVQRLTESGVAIKEAILTAGRRRLRAVLLTASTTVVGLLPTAYGWGGMDPFVSPMALALSWGLMFSTVITLVTVPAVFLAGSELRYMMGNWIRLKRTKPV